MSSFERRSACENTRYVCGSTEYHQRPLFRNPVIKQEVDDNLWILNRFIEAFKELISPPEDTRKLPTPQPTFHKFPLLPPELRIKIWELAFTRIVCVGQRQIPFHEPLRPFLQACMFSIDSCPPPAFLTSHESLALSSPNSTITHFPDTNPGLAKTPMNPKFDICYLSSRAYDCLNHSRRDKKVLSCFRKVATDLDTLQGYSGYFFARQYSGIISSSMEVRLKALRNLEGLEELSFVEWEKVRGWSDSDKPDSSTGKWVGIELFESEEDEDINELGSMVNGVFDKWEVEDRETGDVGWRRPTVRFVMGRNLYE